MRGGFFYVPWKGVNGMKKRTITSLAAVAMALTMSTAYAASGIVMFGDNVQRTHVNEITDSTIWSTEVVLGSGASSGIFSAN